MHQGRSVLPSGPHRADHPLVASRVPGKALAVFAALSLLWTLGAGAAEGDAESEAALRARAREAYQDGSWAGCADLYAALAERPDGGPVSALYNAACCAALAGDAERAFDLLARAAEAGYRDAEHLSSDPDLASLRDRPRWPAAVAAVEAAERVFAGRVHGELYRMYREDQADRSRQPIDWKVVSKRDDERRRRAAEILDGGGAKEPEDFFHAAMIFQHGSEPADYARAEALSRKAVEMDPGLGLARWLIAAAHDRWLHSRGEPQIYGTQFRKGTDGRWSLDPIDADAVTDAEREEMGVPPLAEARRRAEAMNRQAH